MPEGWSITLLNCLPKFAEVERPVGTWPVALQNAVMKWLSMTVLVQLQDVFAQFIAPNQKGFLQGRPRHRCAHALGGELGTNYAGHKPQKALDSVSFAFLGKALLYVGLPLLYVALLMMPRPFGSV